MFWCSSQLRLVDALFIDEAFLDVRGRADIPGTPDRDRGQIATRRTGGGRASPSLSGWPGPSSSPRWRAGWKARRSAGGPPRARSRSCIRCRSTDCGRRPGDHPPAPRPRPDDRRRGRAGLPETALVSMIGPAAGRPSPHAQPRSRSTPSAWSPPPFDRVRSVRSGARPPSFDELDAIVVALVDRVTRRMRGAPRASAARSCSDSGSATSPAPPDPTRCRGRRRGPAQFSLVVRAADCGQTR